MRRRQHLTHLSPAPKSLDFNCCGAGRCWEEEERKDDEEVRDVDALERVGVAAALPPKAENTATTLGLHFSASFRGIYTAKPSPAVQLRALRNAERRKAASTVVLREGGKKTRK